MTLTKSEEAEIINSKDYSTRSIKRFAKKINTHPAIIVGRLQHLKIIDYWQDQQLIEKIDLFKDV